MLYTIGRGVIALALFFLGAFAADFLVHMAHRVAFMRVTATTRLLMILAGGILMVALLYRFF